MGRIQKKKPATKKRKNGGAASGQGGEGAPKKAAPAPAPPKPADPASGLKAPQFWTSSMQFLREVRGELKKVTWPSRKQTMGSTLVVIILVAIISAFLGVVDLGLTDLVKLVLQ